MADDVETPRERPVDAHDSSANLGARVEQNCDSAMGKVVFLVLLASACAGRSATDEGEVRGRVIAADGKTGATCYVELNTTPPLFTPESVEVRTGDEFRHVMTTSGVMQMYAAARCEGYATKIGPPF